MSREMQKECVVVFDEAHNIDNVCIEALSVSIRKQTLEGTERNLRRISQEIDRYYSQLLELKLLLNNRFCFFNVSNFVMGN